MPPLKQPEQWIAEQLKSEEAQALLSASPQGGFFSSLRRTLAVNSLEKSLGRRAIEWHKLKAEADEQGALVSQPFAAHGLYDTDPRGVREPTGRTFGALRMFGGMCDPYVAIEQRRVTQIESFSRAEPGQSGFVKEPGFRFVMTNPDAEASKEDKRNMQELTQFMLETGWCEPPRDERPDGWEPGLANYLSALTRDSLNLDWGVTRTWGSSDQIFKGKWDVVTFAAVDAARIRRIRRPVKEVRGGVAVTEDWQGERTNHKGDIEFVQVSMESSGGQIEAEYTRKEVSPLVRNRRTARDANGYGYPEMERSLKMVDGWLNGRDYNLLRFRKDNMPRGMLILEGNVNEQQLASFRLEFKQMMAGVVGRWSIPIVRGLKEGAKAMWQALDGSSRDMEYHNMMFLMSLCLHANFGIHPEETGYQAISPYRAPLSEGSPEAKLKYSQDWGLLPFLRKIEDHINRTIVWRIYPDRRYRFEFVGLGDYIEANQIEGWQAELAAGLNTPRMIWKMRDMTIPEPLKDHPAWDIPMPFPEGMQYVDQLAMAEQQQQQQVAQMQAQAMAQAVGGGTGMPGQDMGGGMGQTGDPGDMGMAPDPSVAPSPMPAGMMKAKLPSPDSPVVILFGAKKRRSIYDIRHRN